jgi:hypothetical protein
VKLVGPTLSAQYGFQKRFPNMVDYSESTFVKIARIGFIAVGVMLTVAGLVGVIVLV